MPVSSDRTLSNLNPESERGATAILVAFCMVLLMGIAAIAIDLGFGFNERRQSQTAADMAVMAGATEEVLSGDEQAVVANVLAFARANVNATYEEAEWQSMWQNCMDPERLGFDLGTGTLVDFQPLPQPSAWGFGNLECISRVSSYLRVRLPDQLIGTTFGRVLGVNSLTTSAAAVARFAERGGIGGVLPFGLLSNAGEGQHMCLRSGPAGISEPPCAGGSSGNFGAIESPHYGTLPGGPAQNCGGNPKKDVLAVNIAIGIDHFLNVDTDGLAANDIKDTCGNISAGLTPDTLNTFQGVSNGFAEGLAIGTVPGGFTPRLQQGSNPTKFVHGYDLDNKPLWEYIDPGLTSDDVPASCIRSSFNPGPATLDYSLPADGVLDAPDSWQHLSYCFHQYLTTTDGMGQPWDTVMFRDDEALSIADSPRFAYVPQFWESTWPPGNSEWRHIRRFKATWLQATWWKKGNTTNAFHPGEPGTFSQTGNWEPIQLSAIIIPDAALPLALRGEHQAPGGVEPFLPELFR